MEGFTYNNIFETKALEYLIIVFFFIILIPFWRMLNKKNKQEKKSEIFNSQITPAALSLPQGIFFSRYHTWAHMERNGEAKVGLDDLLLHLTGEVTIDQLKKPHTEIKKGEVFATIRSGGKSLQVVSPVSGKIQKVNGLLSDSPELVKNDPYRQGWIYSIKPSGWKEDTSTCYLAEDANNWAQDELARVKDFLAASPLKKTPEPAEVVFQDGGELVEKVLTYFPDEVWNEFQNKFLS